MIADTETNFVYFADLLPELYPKLHTSLCSILDKHSVPHGLIKKTKDIWCRDFMPVQLDKDRFAQFRYEPRYLMGCKEGLDSISNTNSILRKMKLSPIVSNINLDGGNVVKWKDKVIATERLFDENETDDSYPIDEIQLIKDIKMILDIDQLIIIPADQFDIFGHSDGMVRFINENTVFVNRYDLEYENYDLVRNLKISLSNAGIEAIEFPYNPYDNEEGKDATGSYINYLHVGDLIILSSFDLPEDELAVKTVQKHIPNIKVESVNCLDLAMEGGLLNCVSWNIKV